MASAESIAELIQVAGLAGFRPGEVESAVYNVLGFATNSGKRWQDRITEEQCDTLIKLFESKIVTKVTEGKDSDG